MDVDHGAITDQTLISVDKGKQEVMREMFIRAVNNSSITLQYLFIVLMKRTKGLKKKLSLIRKWYRDFVSFLWIVLHN